MPDFDVAIVGYGPVGALGAYLLAEAGLRVVVVEKETEIVDLPRAVNIDGEIVRAFQRVGHGDEIEATTQAPRDPDEVAFTDSKRTPYFTAANSRFGQNGYRDIGFFDQPELEAKIRALIEQQGRVELRLGHEATGIENGRDEATVHTRDLARGMSAPITASYVIGCDGASSFVRRSMAIDWQSLGYDQEWLVIDVIVQDTSDLPLRTMQVCDPSRLTTYVCVKDPNRRWEFQLLPGESRDEMLRPEKIRSLLDPWIAADRYAIRRAAVYQFHAANASTWRRGRIFLAGDAAHQTPPFLGQGLNTGFRDVVNLSWKLPWVLDGTCGDALLDTYEAERAPHAHDLVDWAVAIGKLMEALAATERGDAGAAPPDQSSGYGQGRMMPPLHAGVIATEQVGPHSSTGFLLRQPWVKTKNGSTVRFDELLGPGFAVVARKREDLVLGDNGRATLERLGAQLVALDDIELAKSTYDHLFEDHAAAIVRPDRYVFGTTDDAWTLDRLVASLAEKLALS